jgi:PAS domain S-box-containing protein
MPKPVEKPGTCFVYSMLIVLLLCGLVPPSAHGTEPVVVTPAIEKYPLGLHIDYLRDDTGSLSIEDVSGAAFPSRFVPSTSETLGFGFVDAAYWLRFTIHNPGDRQVKYYLQVEYPLLDSLDLYSRNQDSENGYGVVRTGDHQPFWERPIKHTDFVFEIVLEAGATQEYFLRCQTSSSMNLPLMLLSQSALAENLGTKKMMLGFYFGILLVMLIHNLFIYFSIRDNAYLYYVLFVAFYLLFQFSLNGITFQYLWPDMIWWGNNCIPLFLFAAYFFGTKFTRTILNSRQIAPRFDTILLWLQRVSFCGLFVPFFAGYAISIRLGTLLAMTVFVYIITGFRCMIKGYRPAVYYFVAWPVSMIGVTLYSMKTFGLLPHNFITNWGIQFGSAWEVILFSMSLADRFHLMKKDQERLQVEHAGQLQKANERLEASNTELQQEVVERRRIESALRESRETARALLNAPLNVAALLDENGIVLDANDTLAAELGITVKDLVGTHLWSHFPLDSVVEQRKRYAVKVLKSGKPVRFEDNRQQLWYDNVFFPVMDGEGMVNKVAILGYDISKRKEAEQRRQELEIKALAQAKLASLGEMATGIAHEINQPLSYIKVIYESTLADIREQRLNEEEVADDCREALRQVHRISKIIEHMRVFGRTDLEDSERVYLPKVFDNAMIIFGERLRLANIEIQCEVEENLPAVSGNKNKLEQVFINLLQNSRDALAEKEGALITIEMRYEAEADVVSIVFGDNGAGIEVAAREKIFEPFFTTKEVGMGTGLGLAIVYGIVREHNGSVSCESEPGRGAWFKFKIPATG